MIKKPLRILLINYLQQVKELQAQWYNTDNKIYNGLVRLGHSVLPFSARDVAREVGLLGRQKLGAAAANQRLLAIARHFEPGLIVSGHGDVISEKVWRELRRQHPDTPMIQYNVDPIYSDKAMAFLRQRAEIFDYSFITTADAAIQNLVPDPSRIAFFPNPQCSAADPGRAFAIEKQPNDGFFTGYGTGRDAMLLQLKEKLGPDFTWLIAGGVLGSEKLFSAAYIKAINSARMAPNLPHEIGQVIPYLYSSDRVAQLFGNGLLVFLSQAAGLRDLYGDDGVVYFEDFDDLAKKMAWYKAHDPEARRLAEIGWQSTHQRFSAERITNVMVHKAFGEDIEQDWPDVGKTTLS